MAFLYIDLLKQADAVTNLDSTSYNKPLEANFVVFGTYDWMCYGGFQDSLFQLKARHEERHMLSWKYERQPMFLYCRDKDRTRINTIFSASVFPAHPLVLSLIQIDKTQIVNLADTIDACLEIIHNQVASLVKERAEFGVCWNLGGSDIVIAFRTESLETVAEVIFSIQTHGFCIEEKANKYLQAFSSSSHCAIAMQDAGNGVSETVVQKWLEADKSVMFRALFETTSGHNELINHETDVYMILGERDYEVPFPEDREAWAKMLTSHLSPVQKYENTYHNHASFIMPEIKIRTNQAALAPADELVWSQDENAVFEILDGIIVLIDDAKFAYGKTSDNHRTQLKHCRNSLLGLYKYAYRLRSTIAQYNLFCYVQRLYKALADTFKCYKDNLELIRNSDDIHARPVRFRRLVSELTHQIFLVVSELQHQFSVLAVSTHTYMETYSSSMRSLNAASKLWDAYNGIILTLTDMFPARQGESIRKITIMLSPYRERQSENIQLFPRHSYDPSIVLVQMNFTLMFQADLATYMLVHECGHHLSDSCRSTRFELMTKAMISSLLKDIYDYFVLSPLFMLTTISSKSQKDSMQAIQRYLRLLQKPDKTNDDYKELLAFKMSLPVGEEHQYKVLFERYHAQLHERYQDAILGQIDKMFEHFAENYKKASGNGNYKYDYFYGEELYWAYVNFTKVDRAKNRKWIKDSLKELRNVLCKEGLSFLREYRETERCADQYQLSSLKAFLEFESNEEALEKKLWNMVMARNLPALPEEIVKIFREVHADMFAMIVLNVTFEEYMELLNRFADQHPPLITNPLNLWRVLVVSSTMFPNACGIKRWIEGGSCKYSDDVKRDAIKEISYLSNSPMLQYILKYAESVKEQLETQMTAKASHKRELIYIRNMFREGCVSQSCTDAIWHFWIKSMSV